MAGVGYYNSPPLHSLSIASPTHQHLLYNSPHQHQQQQQQQAGLYQQQQSGLYPQQQQQQQTPQPQPGQSGYLPGFLMGDPVMQSPSTPTPGGDLIRSMSLFDTFESVELNLEL